MAKIVKAACPTCGASLRLDPSLDVVNCNYCGHSALIQRGPQPTPAPVVPGSRRPATIVVPPSSPRASFAVAGVIVMLIVGALGVAVLLRGSGIGAGSGSGLVLIGAPLVADVTGNGSAELLVVGMRVGGESHHMYAFDPFSGKKLWETDALEKESSRILATTQERLLLADRATLHGYDLKTGKRAFTRPLSEASDRFCSRGSQVTLVTEDGTEHAISQADGALTPLGKADASPAGPPCVGFPTFRLSSGFSKVDAPEPDRVPGMSVDSAYRIGTSPDLLLVGKRQPGSAVPMVGVWSGDVLRWLSEVPATEPLRAEAGAPTHFAAKGGRVVVAYRVPSPKSSRVTSFDQTTGKRHWEVTLPEAAWPRLELTERYALFGTSPKVTVLSLSDGKLIRVIGLNR